MKSLILIGVLVVAALAAGLVMLGRPSATPAPTAEADAEAALPAPAASGNPEARIAALERTVAALQRRVQALEGGGAPAAATTTAPPEIKDAVRAANEELRAEQRAEREQRREEMMARRAEERAEAWRKFTADAQLDATTATRIRALLDEEETKRRELFDRMRESGGDPGDLRNEARNLREHTDAEAAKLLNEAQRVKYHEMRDDDRGVMFRGPR